MQDKAIINDLLAVSKTIDNMTPAQRKEDLFRLVRREFRTEETWRTKLLRLIIVDSAKRREFIKSAQNGLIAGVLMFALAANAHARQGCCSWHDGVCRNRCCDGTPLSDKCTNDS